MPKEIALIGTGPVGLGYIMGLAQQAAEGRLRPNEILQIHVFDSSILFGAGSPYDPTITDAEHLLNGTNHHLPAEFAEWMTAENRHKIEMHFSKIFESRLREKFLERFGSEYEKEKRAEYESSKKDLCDHYENLWNSFKRRYLNALNPADIKKAVDYYPRTLLGIFGTTQFEEAVETLESKGFTVVRHAKTEITSIAKADEKFTLHFEGGSLEVDHVAIASGGWRNVATEQSGRYLHNLWPISNLKKDVARIIKSELERRATRGDTNKEIVVAIEGKGLSGIDAAKTLFQEGELKIGDDGTFTFSPNPHNEYTLKLVMVSRTPLLHKVQDYGKSWPRDLFKQPDDTYKYPEELQISQKTFQNITDAHGGKIHLWQVAMILCRAIETGYKITESYHGRNGNVGAAERTKAKAETAREFLYDIISNVKKDDAGTALTADREGLEIFIDNLSGKSEAQCKAIQDHFHLQLDGASYAPIVARFNSMLGYTTDTDPWERLRRDLHESEHGDVEGLTVWRQFLFVPPFNHLLPKEEREYFSRFLGRYMETLVGMPMISAKELLAFHNAGVLDFATLGKDVKRFYLTEDGEKVESSERVKLLKEARREGGTLDMAKDHKVVLEGTSTVVCDLAINATSKFGPGFNPNPLMESLKSAGIIRAVVRVVMFCESDEEYHRKRSEMVSNFGERETEMMLSGITKAEDGKWYSKVTDIPERDNIPLDESGNPTTRNLLIMQFGPGINGSRKVGKEIAIKNFPGSEAIAEAGAGAGAGAETSSSGRGDAPPSGVVSPLSAGTKKTCDRVM